MTGLLKLPNLAMTQDDQPYIVLNCIRSYPHLDDSKGVSILLLTRTLLAGIARVQNKSVDRPGLDFNRRSSGHAQSLPVLEFSRQQTSRLMFWRVRRSRDRAAEGS